MDEHIKSTSARPLVTNVVKLLHKNGKRYINLNAPYQRGAVWKEEQKRAFIVALVRGTTPAPILFNKKRIGNKNELVCIDGKQRILALNEYIQNCYSVPFNGKETYYNDNRSNSISVKLNKREKKFFDMLTLRIVYYRNITYEEEKEIFENVNKGIPLVPEDKLLLKTNERISTAVAQVTMCALNKGFGILIPSHSEQKKFHCIVLCSINDEPTANTNSVKKYLGHDSKLTKKAIRKLEAFYESFLAEVVSIINTPSFSKIYEKEYLLITLVYAIYRHRTELPERIRKNVITKLCDKLINDSVFRLEGQKVHNNTDIKNVYENACVVLEEFIEEN